MLTMPINPCACTTPPPGSVTRTTGTVGRLPFGAGAEGPLVPADRRRRARRAARRRRPAPPRAVVAVPRADRGRVRPDRLRRDAHALRHRLRGRMARDRVAGPAHTPGEV